MIRLKRMRWAWKVVRTVDEKNTYRMLVRKIERSIPMERPRLWRLDNTKIDISKKNMGLQGLD
jgi:hypothetical protein